MKNEILINKKLIAAFLISFTISSIIFKIIYSYGEVLYTPGNYYSCQYRTPFGSQIEYEIESDWDVQSYREYIRNGGGDYSLWFKDKLVAKSIFNDIFYLFILSLIFFLIYLFFYKNKILFSKDSNNDVNYIQEIQLFKSLKESFDDDSLTEIEYISKRDIIVEQVVRKKLSMLKQYKDFEVLLTNNLLTKTEFENKVQTLYLGIDKEEILQKLEIEADKSNPTSSDDNSSLKVAIIVFIIVVVFIVFYPILQKYNPLA